jgi:hypothetical protein
VNDLSQKLEAGTLLIIETGEYSDRDWRGPVRLIAPATKQELVDAFKSEWKKEDYPESWRDAPGPEDFLPWLIKSGRAEDVENVHAWHVGSYGEFEPE